MKKSFSDIDVVKQFISAPQEQPEEAHEETPAQAQQLEKIEKTQHFKYKKGNKETKSVRMQLILKPSTVTKLKQAAAEADTSVNDFISQLLDSVL